MKAINFVGSDGVWTEPTDWPNYRPPCGKLYTMKEDGVFYSCWKLSWKQRLAVLFGHCVVLGVMCKVHPPVAIGTSKVTEIK